MKLKRNSTRRIFIIGMVVLALFAASDTCASPLYGGYNGESETWVEVYIVEVVTVGLSLRISIGVDPYLSATWIRIGISSLFLLPYVSNIEFSYETGDIVSASLTGIIPVKIGADTNDLQWWIANFLTKVIGVDSDDNSWSEKGLTGMFGIPGVFATGEDNNNHHWQWIKFFPVLVGWREELASQQGIFLNQENFHRFEEELRSLRDHLTRACGPRLSALLLEKLTDDEVMGGVLDHLEELSARMVLPLIALSIYENSEELFPMDLPSVVPSELNTLLTYVEEEIFTEGIRGEVNLLLDTLARDIQPRLEVIKKIVTSPQYPPS